MRSLQSMTHRVSDPDDTLKIAVSENLQKYILWKCFQSRNLSCIRSDFIFTHLPLLPFPEKPEKICRTLEILDECEITCDEANIDFIH